MRAFSFVFGIVIAVFFGRFQDEPQQNPPREQNEEQQEEDEEDQNGEANQHENEEAENEEVEIPEPVLDDPIVVRELVPEQEPVPNELDNEHEQNEDAEDIDAEDADPEVAEIEQNDLEQDENALEPVNDQQDDAMPQEPIGHPTEAVHRERIHLRPFQGLRRGTRLQIGDQYLRIRGEQEGSYEHPARNVFEENLFQL